MSIVAQLPLNLMVKEFDGKDELEVVISKHLEKNDEGLALKTNLQKLLQH